MSAICAALVYLSIFTGQCKDPITDYINRRFPPVSSEIQHQAAVTAAATTLHQVGVPNLAFGAPLAQLQTVLLTKDLLSQGVKTIRLSAEHQLVRAEISFDKTFDSDADTAQGRLLNELRPQVLGTLVVLAGISSAATQGDRDATVTMKILPAFRTLHVDKVLVKGSYDVTILGDAAAEILNKFSDNVSGVLSTLSALEIKVPTTSSETFNPNKVLTIRGGTFNGSANVTGNAVAAPIALRGVAWTVDGDRLAGLADLVPTSEQTKGDEGPVVDATDDAVSMAFKKAFAQGFGIDSPPAAPWVAIRKDIVAFAINTALKHARICVAGSGTVPKQDFSQQIKFPDETSVDCTPTRDCSPTRSCDFVKSHDDRDCSACVVKKPWGGCLIRGNDPTCEIAKAAQNKAYEADYAAKKLDCERLKSQEKGQCEAEKEGEKALCETGKEFLKRLARTGKFANIDGSFQGQANVNACLGDTALASDLTSIQTAIDLSGSAVGELYLKFVPLDIVGNLTCQIPWTDQRKVSATIPETTIPIRSSIRLVTDTGPPKYIFATEATSVKLSIRPGPTEYMLTSMNMTLSCQGLNLIKPLIIPATAFVPQLRGDFDQKIDGIEGALAIKVPALKLGSDEIEVGVSESTTALLLQGKVAPRQ